MDSKEIYTNIEDGEMIVKLVYEIQEEITAKEVTSEPVPDVVGIAINAHVP